MVKHNIKLTVSVAQHKTRKSLIPHSFFQFFFISLGTGTHFLSVSLIFLSLLLDKQKEKKNETVSSFYLFIFSYD